jgi:phage baseplate assembly protein W
MDGNFGTSLRDLIMDPLTEETKQLIIEEVNTVINSDPRVRPEEVTLDEYENGLQIQIVLRYVIDNQVENLQVRFDRPDNLTI